MGCSGIRDQASRSVAGLELGEDEEDERGKKVKRKMMICGPRTSLNEEDEGSAVHTKILTVQVRMHVGPTASNIYVIAYLQYTENYNDLLPIL